jgi:lactose/L-arabinose transport system substrate-binding protein
MKKIVWIVFGLVVLSLVGCAGKSKDNQEESEQIPQIIIWTWDETFNVKAAKLAADEYTKINNDVNIVVESMEREEILSSTKKILAAGAYDKLPDIIMLEDYDVADVLSTYEDEFVNLTDRVDYDKFADYKSNLCSRSDQKYGIPFDSGAAALFYRIDILEQAGFSESDMENLTWDEFIDIGMQVYEKTGVSMLTLDPSDFPVLRLIMQSCGKWYVTSDGKAADIEKNDALQQGCNIYQRLLETNVAKSVNGWNEFISAFQKGEVACVVSGSWIISNIKAASDQSGLWRVAPIPVVSDDENAVAASNVGGSSWYVMKNSQNSKAATDFVVEMYSENDEFMDSLITNIGVIPAVKNPEIYNNYEKGDDFFGGQKVTKFLTGLADEIPTVNYGNKTYEIEAIVEAEFQNILSQMDIDTALSRAQVKADALLRE